MATKTVTFRCQEEESRQMAQSMKLESQVKRKKFQSSDEEASYSEYYPIIPGDLISAKELLGFGSASRHRTWTLHRRAVQDDAERRQVKWTRFGNEAERLELGWIQSHRTLRTRADLLTLRREAERKVWVQKKFLEDLSLKPPDFPIPLRCHTVWEGMGVKLTCTVQGYPPPRVSWYKDGVPLNRLHYPWNYKLRQSHGLNVLEIRRCSGEDAGEYQAIAKSRLGEASTFATLLVNAYEGLDAGLECFSRQSPEPEPEALFGVAFPPSFAREGDSITLRCGFTSPLLPFQQDVAWYRDGVRVCESTRTALQTGSTFSSLTLKVVHKEHEGVYTVRLRTSEGLKEHSAYVYVRDGASEVLGAPASPLGLKCSDVNRDYVFLTWTPPSADGASRVEGYYVEMCHIGVGRWVRCNRVAQKACCYPVTGLTDGALYQFRVLALNQVGEGRPSRPTDPILTSDPAEPGRTMVVKVDRGREIIITKDQVEGEIRVPFPPTDVGACEVSDTYAVVSWNEPEPRGREKLTFYVERTLAGGASWRMASLDQVISSPRFAAFDLQQGESYVFRVRSVNKYGVSDPSLPSAPISLCPAPPAPPAPPQGVLAVRDTDASVLVRWREGSSSGDVLGYYLYYCPTGTSDWTTVNNKPTSNTSFTVHGLRKNKEYVFRVKAVSRAGNSEYSEESNAVLVKAAIRVPSAPSGVALLNCTGSEMVIGWRAPASSGGDGVRGYFLDQTDAALQLWGEVNAKPAVERVYKVSGLLEGRSYQFRVRAANIAGVGQSSEPSPPFLCQEWTMPEPGCPYDLEFRDVRETSLVLLWEGPLYEGGSPVTGYLVEVMEEGEAEGWISLTPEPVADTNLQVSSLTASKTYRLRVSAVNEAGVGAASLATEPITAQRKPGTKDIEIGVDDDGFVFLAFESQAGDEFSWAKNYKEAIEAGRATVKNKDCRSTLTFSSAGEEDLGLYTAAVTDCPEASASYDFTAEDLERMLELSWNVLNPLIPLVSPWAVEVQETGAVRLWMQTVPLSRDAELHLIFNDREITSTPARKIHFDRASGLVEVLMENMSLEDEGSYTAQLRDGRAKNQFTLVLVDEKFRKTLAQARAKLADLKRKAGPYFSEYLSWEVTDNCEVIIKCKVTNVSKDTRLSWSKDEAEMKEFAYEEKSGVSSVTVTQMSDADAGVYRAVASDTRGEDVSVLTLLSEEYEKLQQELSRRGGLTASALRLQPTAEGFRLFCSLKLYLSYMKTSWFFKEKRIDQEARSRTGSSSQNVWIDILGPTESDKGKYVLEMFDGVETHRRTMDLSGQAFADAMQEYQRLKLAALAEKNRAKVTKGLPDVVAIMENKTLCLTCFTEGDPAPEMRWLKNERALAADGPYEVASDGQRTTLTIGKVTSEDSGLYSLNVSNKHGSDTVQVMVSVYKHGELPPPDAVELW